VILKFLAFALALASLTSSKASVLPQAAQPYKITDVRAHLFYSGEGTFSGNLIGSEGIHDLWNTIIGKGGAGGASSTTLIVVEVSGKPRSYGGKSAVELIVHGSTKEIFRRTQQLAVLSDKGKAYVGFWLYDTGCDPLRVSATLVGVSKSTSSTIEIPFRCGE
jgi:hypothetical protein